MNQNNMTKNTDNDRPAIPLAAGWIIPITLFSGLTIGGLLAGNLLYQCNQRQKGIIISSCSVLFGIGLLIFCFFWKIEWYWIALTLSTIHIASSILLFLIARKPVTEVRSGLIKKEKRGRYRQEITGVFGGLIAALIIGPLAIICYMLITDWLFSTFMPIIFTDEGALSWFYFCGAISTLAGMVAGGLLGRFKPTISVSNSFIHAVTFFWAFITLAFWLQVIIGIPAFQASATTGKYMYEVTAPLTMFLLFFGTGWTICLMFYCTSRSGALNRITRLLQIVLVNLFVTLLFSVTFGFPSDFFLFLGQHYERRAKGEQSLKYYEYGLNKAPKDNVASYLQYRIALLYYKTGKIEKAVASFRRVIAKYYANEDLVKKANYFQKRLLKGIPKNRVVLPGAETRTEYKGSYCVPNSLALTMRYWGEDISPREIGKAITGLSKGTYIVDQTWFAQNEGFKHDFLTLAEIEDIKALIDAGFPVLVYVPAHIFVIFGYDETLSTFVTYDVATQDVWVEYIQKDFIKAWKKQATALAILYPASKESTIPDYLRKRLSTSSEQYLHYQLHHLDTTSSRYALAHLHKAAGNKNDFFLPVVTMYNEYPGLRDSISKKYDSKKIAEGIFSFFSKNFDEGTHLWGQYHEDEWASTDWALRYSISYLLAHKQYEAIENLITNIDQKGEVTSRMFGILGMIDLAHGRFNSGFDRLQRASSRDYSLYTGLLSLQNDNIGAAIRSLYSVADSKSSSLYYKQGGLKLGLDRYGYPVVPLAHSVLGRFEDYGEISEDIQEHWEDWLEKCPYDITAAQSLCNIYKQNLDNLEQKGETELYEILFDKYKLMKERAERYDITHFK